MFIVEPSSPRTELSLAAILFGKEAGWSAGCIILSRKMEQLRKGYQARIREDVLSETTAGNNKIKMYQEYFQVSKMV